jgi:hypothetical protein
MTVTTRSLPDLTKEAIGVLCRELGVADTARFLRHFGAVAGDYTKERDALIGDMSLEEIFAEARRIQESGVPR